MKRFISLFLISILLICLTACRGTQSDSAETDRVQIMTAMFAEYDFARQIAGRSADVQMLLPPGADMHSYEPTPKNIIDIKNSDVFIYGGGESDSWIDEVLESIGGETKAVKMIDACELLHEEEHSNESHGHDHDEYDEHVWTSPKNAIKIVEAITDALCSADEKNAEEYRKNEENYIAELEELDSDFRLTVNTAKRHEMVFADRFPLLYFAHEYNLEYLAAFPGCSHDTEASAGKVRELIDKVKSDNIPVIFKIEMSSSALAETVSQETGAEILEFNSCHGITRSQFESGETYLSLMRQNLEYLKIALN